MNIGQLVGKVWAGTSEYTQGYILEHLRLDAAVAVVSAAELPEGEYCATVVELVGDNEIVSHDAKISYVRLDDNRIALIDLTVNSAVHVDSEEGLAELLNL